MLESLLTYLENIPDIQWMKSVLTLSGISCRNRLIDRLITGALATESTAIIT